jgi:hypothetical protein
LESDIIIEDRKLVALGGNDLATQSSTGTTSSYYSKLIESLADSIRTKGKLEESEWSLDTYKLTTEKIINLVSKTKSAVARRFVWFRQFPDPHYVVMTRIETINKLANDLVCQMRKLKAREMVEAQDASKQQQQKSNQRRYAQSLILKVCRAARKGISPYRAVLLLDSPIVKTQESGPISSDEKNTNNNSRSEAPDVTESPESEVGRKLRLQLRHRFLACIRSKKCIFDLANALLTMWELPNVSKIAPKSKKRKRSETTTTKAKREKVEVVPQNIGTWNCDERVAFLKGVDKHGMPNWIKIAQFIPTR